MASLLGEVGRYTLYERIAEGGMAEVFLAEQNSEAGVRKLVALKRMLPHLGRQERFVAMFLDEARLAARLTHQNIAQVLDFGVDGDRYFLVMEYITGESLQNLLRTAVRKGQPVPFDVALTIVSQACDGLHYAHTLHDGATPLNIVHRDVTLSNVLVTAQGAVKIIDFGIARAANRLQDQTTEGVFKGKVAYASPEQLLGRELDARSDVFSLGVLLYELTTSERLFRRDNEMASMHAVLQDPIPSVRRSRPDLPAALDAVLARALARAPKDRFSSALELRKAVETLMPPRPQRVDDWMEQLLGGKPREPTLPPRSSPSQYTQVERALAADSSRATQVGRLATPPEPPPPPAPAPRRAWGLPGAGLVLLAVAGGGAWFALRTPEPIPEVVAPVVAPPPAPVVAPPVLAPVPVPVEAPEVVKEPEVGAAPDPVPAPEPVPVPVPVPKPKSTKPPRAKAKPRPAAPTENPLTL